jgi:3'(2'), 5'-bisphosphate nucleotidase
MSQSNALSEPSGLPALPLDDWMTRLADLARDAGEAILEHYAAGATARLKPDASPVTDADEAAERIILAGLRALAPDIPIISEESYAAGIRPALARRFFLVDPLDGTKEFLKRNGEFTVNIALIEDGMPILGIVHVPAQEVTYCGLVDARAELHGSSPAARVIRCRACPPEGLTVVVSRSHANPEELARYLSGRPVAAETTAGSSLKFCLLAAGEADLYPRFGPTMEWDTAAGHAVLRAAGGSVETLDGKELRYGKPDFRNPAFIARGISEADAEDSGKSATPG